SVGSRGAAGRQRQANVRPGRRPPQRGSGPDKAIPARDLAHVVESEGGHVTLGAATAREEAVVGIMRRRYDHVSAERVLSGPGLINLYNVLCELDGIPAASFTAPQITAEQEDVRAKEAKDMFCEMLGTVAGNLALTLGLTLGLPLGPHSWPSLLVPH